MTDIKPPKEIWVARNNETGRDQYSDPTSKDGLYIRMRGLANLMSRPQNWVDKGFTPYKLTLYDDGRYCYEKEEW